MAAHAESRYQLQAGFLAGSGPAGAPLFAVAPTVSVGVESGDSVWLLGLGVQAARNHQFVAGGVENSQPVFVTGDEMIIGATIAPGYRRNLAGFESGFAPLVEASLEISAAHATVQGRSIFTTLGLGATAGFGGEARFGDHFAIDARVFGRLGGARQSGDDVPGIYSLTFGLGTSAGVVLRF